MYERSMNGLEEMESVKSKLGVGLIAYSLMATMLISGFSRALRATIRPMRPERKSDTFAPANYE